MTLNVNLEDVPFAILEAVRGRIMSNRRRLQENQEQQQQRPALQPKPQFRKFGADGRTWKRPEPAAILDNEKYIVGAAYWENDSDNNTLTVYSADKQASSTVTLDFAGQQGSVIEWDLCLPAGNGNLLLIFHTSAFSATDANDGVSPVVEDFQVSLGDLSLASSVVMAQIEARRIALEENAAIFQPNITAYRISETPIILNKVVETRLIGGTLRPEFDTFVDISPSSLSWIGYGTPDPTKPLGVRDGWPNSGVASYVFKSNYVGFYVSKNVVRPVDVPATLESILQDKMPLASVQTDSIDFPVLTYRYSQAITHLDYFSTTPGGVADEWITESAAFAFSYSDYEIIQESTRQINYAYVVRSDSDDIGDLLLRSYGYGYLVDNTVQTQGRGWTPSVYAFLRAPSSNNASSSNYKTLRDTYLGSSAPRRALTLGYQSPSSGADTTNSFFHFQIPATADADAENALPIFSSSNLRLSRVTAGTKDNPLPAELSDESSQPPPIPTPVAAWDWNRPSACIGELMALGFTAEQLGYTGSTPPQRFQF
jgi:hypothetical protein